VSVALRVHLWSPGVSVTLGSCLWFLCCLWFSGVSVVLSVSMIDLGVSVGLGCVCVSQGVSVVLMVSVIFENVCGSLVCHSSLISYYLIND
jgi:hypothetical protein